MDTPTKWMKYREYAKYFLARELPSSFPETLFVKYDEPHRFYHTWHHISDMLERLETDPKFKDYRYDKELITAILFHDAVCDPKRNDNEEMSVEFFKKFAGDKINDFPNVPSMIMDTKTHKTDDPLSNVLCQLDMWIIKDAPLDEQFEYENQIFKEYQFADLKKYKEKRLEVLASLGAHQELISYVRNRKPNIAVFAGSFKPFHIGHMDILLKGEKIFDKVILAQGLNVLKQDLKQYEFPAVVQSRQIETYSGLLTDFLKDLGYPVTLIRGLRDEQDLKLEITQQRFMERQMPGINVCYLVCGSDRQHISSSAIRQLELYGRDKEYLVSKPYIC